MMSKLKRKTPTAGLLAWAVLCIPCTYGQTWSWSSDLPYQQSHALDCIEGADGRIHVAVGAKVLSMGSQFALGHVFALSPTGAWVAEASIAFPDAGVVPYGFVADSANGTLLVFSDVTDSLLFMGPEGNTIGLTSFTPDLDPISAYEVATGFGQAGQIVLPLPNGEAAVGIIALPYGSSLDYTITLMRVDLQGNLLDNDFITQCAFCGATSMSNRSGGDLLGTFKTGLSNAYSGGDLLYVDSTGSVLATHGTPSIDDTLETYHTILSAFVVRPLASGRLVLAGATRPQEDYQSVLQLTDSAMSEVYAQFFPFHENIIDHPGVSRCLDMNTENEIFFGQSEHLNPSITLSEPGWPSAVRLYRLDTSLNVTGSYLVDGFADSSYYFLRSVRTTADGGALLTGSVADVRMNATDLRTKAWVAKVSMDDLSLGVANQPEKRGWLFPNPSTGGFRIELAQPIHGGVLRILDAQGRMVREQGLDGIGWDVGTGTWSAGNYFVHVIDASGERQFSSSMVKE